MIPKNVMKTAISILVCLTFLSCGSVTEKQPVFLSGNVDFGSLDQKNLGPVFVAVLSQSPVENNSSISDSLLDIQSIDKNQAEFRFQLTDKAIAPGDPVYIIAFADNDFANGIPLPGPGDYIGYYLDKENLSPAYILKAGENTGVEISITKGVFDFKAALAGQVLGSETGTMMVFAYAGEINSLDFSNMDPYKILGYTQFEKGPEPQDFTLDILPYGWNVPISDVYLLAFLDRNANGKPDGGDLFGFYADENNMPNSFIIYEGTAPGFTLSMSMDVPEPSGYNLSIQGHIDVPDDIQAIIRDKDLFVALVSADENTDLSALAQGDLASLAYYSKLSSPERDFDFDLSGTGLAPGDEVIAIVFCDMNYQSGFPNLATGDYMGYYLDVASLGPEISLKEGVNSGIDIRLDKKVYDYKASVSGVISGTPVGLVSVFAYAGEINSLDYSAIDPDKIIAYTRVSKTSLEASYTLDILPYGNELPLENIYLFAFLDTNVNDTPDAGDVVGFYTLSQGTPQLITILGEEAQGYDIQLNMEVPVPSGDQIRISGSVDIPGALNETLSDKPIFLMMVRADNQLDFNALMEGDVSHLILFSKLAIGTRTFDIDLSDTGLAAGDQIIVLAMVDMQYTSGFPDIGEGDYVGYYLNYETLGPELTVNAGDNNGIVVTLDKEVYDYESSLSGRIPSGLTGIATVFAYAGEITSSDFSEIDPNDMIGYSRLVLTGEATDYTVPIFPYGRNLPIENVYLMIYLDANGNNQMDAGDSLGFYSDQSGMPQLISITDGDQPDLDLVMSMEMSAPSGEDIRLSGHIDVPSSLTGIIDNQELFLFVFKADDNMDISSLSSGDMSSVAYFKKLPSNSRDFSVDLSNTDLMPGDQVLVVVLCDMDYQAGFPNPTVGDYLGYFINASGMGPELTLLEGLNEDVDITLGKEVFDYAASLSGQVSGMQTGEVTVFAYAGDITSLDFSQFDPNEIVGYTRIDKISPTQAFNFSILPYGHNVPIENVYLFAFLDDNANGVPDAGDSIGFYANDQGLPKLLTINPGSQDNLTVTLSMELPEPSGYTMSMEGSVVVASSLDVTNKPIFILVIRSGDEPDISAMMEGNLDDVAYFYKMLPNTRNFSFDLSETDLYPGEKVMVVAVCDRQFVAGFPDITAGDYMGYYQDKALMDESYILSQGVNHVEGYGDKTFTLNKILYEHSASILFQLDDANLDSENPSVYLDPGEHVTVVAVHEDGVDLTGDMSMDMDYIVGFASVTIPAGGNDGHTYVMDVLAPIDYRVPVQSPFAIEDVYIFAIFDGNLNGQAGQNNYVGFYWRPYLLYYMYPKVFSEIIDGINILDKTVRFTTQTM
ncbi:MAG: hypothetical protein KKD44_04580 [Proteobacteria bacterium]|nr:hypothetical protein [Pseudomonadota bacterium]